MSTVPANSAVEPVAMTRYWALAPHLDGEATLKAAAAAVPYRTMQRWLADYRRGGLEALPARAARTRAGASCPRTWWPSSRDWRCASRGRR